LLFLSYYYNEQYTSHWAYIPWKQDVTRLLVTFFFLRLLRASSFLNDSDSDFFSTGTSVNQNWQAHYKTTIYVHKLNLCTTSPRNKYLLWVLSVCPGVSSSMILSTMFNDCVAYEDQWIILLGVDNGTRRMCTLTDGAITK